MIRITGLDELISRVESYANSFDRRKDTFLTKLAEIGQDLALVRFYTAQYDGDMDDLTSGLEWVDGNTLRLYFSGHSVTFVEFGTGINYEEHPQASEFGAIHGEFGKGHGANPPWVYVGYEGTNGEVLIRTNAGKNIVRTYGNPPAKAMYDAWLEMKERIYDIAKEVFYG